MDFAELYNGNITGNTTLFGGSTNSIIKTILFCNTTDTEGEVVINIDGVSFYFTVASHNTLSIDKTIVCKSLGIDATGSVHVSGLR